MSRLYGKLTSDRRKTDATAGANEFMEVTFTWNRASDPRVAMIAYLTWRKGDNVPTLKIDTSDDINVQVYSEEGVQYVRKHD